MSMDLTGIQNRNEYYTNHYFASTFESNAADTIKAWREIAQGTDVRTPWALLRDAGKQYFQIRNRQERRRGSGAYEDAVTKIVQELLAALGYDAAAAIPELEEIPGNPAKVPVALEVNKENGAPLLWTILVSPDSDQAAVDNDEVSDASDLMGYAPFAADLRFDHNKPFTEETLNRAPIEELLGRLLYDLDESPRWILLISENQVALIDRNKWNEKRFLVFDLDEIFGRNEESTLQAMAVLLHRESLCPVDGGCLLDTLDENSHRHAIDVSQKLKYALRQSIEILGNEVVYDMRERQHVGVFGRALAEDLTLQCLRYMYRILFMLFIEAKPELGYAPMKAQTYESGYSFESLREICEQAEGDGEIDEDGNFLKESLDKLFSLVYNGFPTKAEIPEDAESLQGVFVIEPLKSHIFDPERTVLIEKAHIRNGKLLQIINLMSMSRGGKGQRRGRISYSNLGVNQLGAVYEALLSYRGFFAEEDLYEVKKAGDKVDELDVGYFIPVRELEMYTEDERVRNEDGSLRVHQKGEFIYRLAGREREKSASYYTPEVLTRCLVKYALKELLDGKNADEILELTICEPAMGSAAFLNEAVSQLAEAYLERKQKETGLSIPHDQRQQELQKIKMLIADRNVYGIDLNPTAVELAEVSLWLNTIFEGGYVPWFRTQIVNGNSLIGARRQCYTLDQAQAKGPEAWYNSAPERVVPGTKRSLRRQQVYHFLLGDPSMCAYTDKVIKGLEPEKIAAIKKWNKAFTAPLTDSEADDVLRLCAQIDALWEAHTQLRAEIKDKTTDPLSVWGQVQDATHQRTTIRDKDRIYDSLYLSKGGSNASPYARLKAVMDYWCALWFWPIDKAEELPNRMEFLWDINMLLGVGVVDTSGYKGRGEGQMSLFDDIEMDSYGRELADRYGKYGAVNLDQLRADFPRLHIANEVAEQQKFFHWELEFSDVFEERGGFDLVVGNPPWIKVVWNEQNVLSDENPIFAVKKLSATQTAQRRTESLASGVTRALYFSEYEQVSGQQTFLGATQNYPDIQGAVNLFKCFLPQAWDYTKHSGVSAYVHPENVFEDPNGGILREKIYKKLRKHFQFENELNLFEGTNDHGRMRFSLNVYCNEATKAFDAIFNLYDPLTIDLCYASDGAGVVPGIKDEAGNWNTNGHKSRIVHISKTQLDLFSRIFDGDGKWNHVSLPSIHCSELIDVLMCFSLQKETIKSLGERVYTTGMFHETNSQTDGLIETNISFPAECTTPVYSGAHIGSLNPVFQVTRREYKSSNDYDKVDLVTIAPDYRVRLKYQPSNIKDFDSRIPKTPWGKRVTEEYRLINREMVGCSSERTLISSIVAPRISHVNTLFSVSMYDIESLVVLAGCEASLPYDFLVKSIGKGHVNFSTTMLFPILRSKYNDEIILRTLLLNCLTTEYAPLWNQFMDKLPKKLIWAKSDMRLVREQNYPMLWDASIPLRTDYERRQALVELDVLVAMALGMKLEQLKTIYRIQFPVLQAYEQDTWYDANGRIVFSPRSMGDLVYKRPEWESALKGAPAGARFYRTITDDTQPRGPIQRTIEYVAPFDKCDREQDYETVWRFFEEKYS